ncbi:21632_t:CDS:2, partial [Racocetra persica]
EIGPYFVFLDINIVDSNFPKRINDSTQISSFRMVAYDSEAVPMSPSNKNNISLRIGPRSFSIKEEEEQRHNSLNYHIPKSLGVDSIRLWGVVHSGCCGIRIYKEKTKAKIDKDLESIIIGDENNLNSNRNSQIWNKNSQSIKTRIEELEKFRYFIEKNVIKISPWG